MRSGCALLEMGCCVLWVSIVRTVYFRRVRVPALLEQQSIQEPTTLGSRAHLDKTYFVEQNLLCWLYARITILLSITMRSSSQKA